MSLFVIFVDPHHERSIYLPVVVSRFFFHPSFSACALARARRSQVSKGSKLFQFALKAEPEIALIAGLQGYFPETSG